MPNLRGATVNCVTISRWTQKHQADNQSNGTDPGWELAGEGDRFDLEAHIYARLSFSLQIVGVDHVGVGIPRSIPRLRCPRRCRGRGVAEGNS